MASTHRAVPRILHGNQWDDAFDCVAQKFSQYDFDNRGGQVVGQPIVVHHAQDHLGPQVGN
eukprot:5681056-Amphidinium_carterae.1